jgi:hypothetical protein
VIWIKVDFGFLCVYYYYYYYYFGFCLDWTWIIFFSLVSFPLLFPSHTQVGFFILPSLRNDEKLKRKAISVFCKMYTLPEIRKAFADWADQVAGTPSRAIGLILLSSSFIIFSSSFLSL